MSSKRRIAKLWKDGKIYKVDKGGLNCLMLPWNWPQSKCNWLLIWMWLVDLNYNFKCDWLNELSDNKLSNNCLITTWHRISGKWELFTPITIEDFVIFKITIIITIIIVKFTAASNTLIVSYRLQPVSLTKR